MPDDLFLAQRICPVLLLYGRRDHIVATPVPLMLPGTDPSSLLRYRGLHGSTSSGGERGADCNKDTDNSHHSNPLHSLTLHSLIILESVVHIMGGAFSILPDHFSFRLTDLSGTKLGERATTRMQITVDIRILRCRHHDSQATPLFVQRI